MFKKIKDEKLLKVQESNMSDALSKIISIDQSLLNRGSVAANSSE